MSDVQVFTNNELAVNVRVVKVEGSDDPWFVASDVAKALCYDKPNNAINQHCRHTLKQGIGLNTGSVDGNGNKVTQFMQVNIIPESDVYRLIMRSNLPTAEKFQDWVCDEVLPSIRKHKFYGTDDFVDEALNNPDAMIKILMNYKEEREKRKQAEMVIEQNKPKVEFYEQVSDSKNNISIGTLAKLISKNGVSIGRNKLFEWLRHNKYLMTIGTDRNVPCQRYVDMGVLAVEERTYKRGESPENYTNIKPVVTGKGQIYFLKKFIPVNKHDSLITA